MSFMAIRAKRGSFAVDNARQSMHILGRSLKDILVAIRTAIGGVRRWNFCGSHGMGIVAIGTQRRLFVAVLDQCRVDTVFILREFLGMAGPARLAHAEGEVSLALDRFYCLAVGLCIDV